MKIDEPVNCIFFAYNITHDKPTCMLNHRWVCMTDSSWCGDVCPDFTPEEKP